MKLFKSLLPKLLGRNLEYTPREVILDQLNESRPLPQGRQEFEDWSNRIIAGAMIAGGLEDPDIFIESQKFTLAGLIMHLGPTESHKPDAFFIHSLRKLAANQVAHTIGEEIRNKAKERLAKEEEEKKAKPCLEVCPPPC